MPVGDGYSRRRRRRGRRIPRWPPYDVVGIRGRRPAGGSMWTSPSSAIWGRMKDNHVSGPFLESSFGVVADGHANAHGLARIRRAKRRLRRSSEIIRFPAAPFGKSPVGQSGGFRRRKKTGTSRLHTSVTSMRPYALRMQPYAVRMHFFGSSRKLGGSRAESTCKEPYALYAPLLGVGPFSALFLLRELHTVHKTAYGDDANQALALLPVGIEALSAREIEKCIRICIRPSARIARRIGGFPVPRRGRMSGA